MFSMMGAALSKLRVRSFVSLPGIILFYLPEQVFYLKKYVRNKRIKMFARAAHNNIYRFLRRKRLFIGPLADKRVKYVNNRHNTALQGDIQTFKAA
jgi:hypothetical protein